MCVPLPATNKNSWWTVDETLGLPDFYSFHWNIYTNYEISVDTIDEWRQNIDINAQNLACNGPPKNQKRKPKSEICKNRGMIQKFAAGAQIHESCDCREKFAA